MSRSGDYVGHEGNRPVAYIIAVNREAATQSAKDWGWENKLPQGLITHRGEMCYYIHEPDGLHGVRDCRMHLGRGWEHSMCSVTLHNNKFLRAANITFVTNIVYHELTYEGNHELDH